MVWYQGDRIYESVLRRGCACIEQPNLISLYFVAKYSMTFVVNFVLRIGKLMLLGAIFGCLDPVLTIGAILSHRSPFVSVVV